MMARNSSHSVNVFLFLIKTNPATTRYHITPSQGEKEEYGQISIHRARFKHANPACGLQVVLNNDPFRIIGPESVEV